MRDTFSAIFSLTVFVVPTSLVAFTSASALEIPAVQTQAAPTATTGAASNVTASSAQFNATINPNGATTSAYFQYGTTTSYGSSSSPGSFSGTSNTPVQVTLSGASPNTTYHYRIVATNSGGTTNGTDASFTTLGAGSPSPSIYNVTPNPVTGSDQAVTFTISGGNFNGSSVVNLRDVTKNASYLNRTIVSESSNQIVIKPVFGVEADTWTVEVVNGQSSSGQFQFTVQSPTMPVLAAPVLVSPGNTNMPGTVLGSNSATFAWQAASGADRYDLFIGKMNTSGGYDAVFNTQTSGVTISGSLTTFSLPGGVLQSGGMYRWNMSTHNSAGSGAANAAFLYFQTATATAVLPPPSLIGPGSIASPGQSIAGTTPSFSWQSVQGADR